MVSQETIDGETAAKTAEVTAKECFDALRELGVVLDNKAAEFGSDAWWSARREADRRLLAVYDLARRLAETTDNHVWDVSEVKEGDQVDTPRGVKLLRSEDGWTPDVLGWYCANGHVTREVKA